MKTLLDKHEIMNDKQWAELSESIAEYNEYIMAQMNKIFDFDIWYEHSKTKVFPREWYSMIHESAAHK